MTKKVQVVMLPTKEKNWPKGRIRKCIGENIYVSLGKLEIDTIGHKLPNYMINTLNYWEPQHLYFISDDPIQEGDWVYEKCKVGESDIKDINKCTSIDNKNGWIFFEKYQTGLDWCKKIIACTNEKLGLPLIPQQWVRDEYVPSNGSITEVELEQELWPNAGGMSERLELKFTSNNEVVISGSIQDKAMEMVKEAAFKKWQDEQSYSVQKWKEKYGDKMPWGTELHEKWVGWTEGFEQGVSYQQEQFTKQYTEKDLETAWNYAWHVASFGDMEHESFEDWLKSR